MDPFGFRVVSIEPQYKIRKTPAPNCHALLLCLFMLRMGFTPSAILLELYFARDELAVLARPIIDAAALRAREFD